MKKFQCSNCSHPVFFDNTYCEHCNSEIGYFPDLNEMLAFDTEEGKWLSTQGTKNLKHCSNLEHDTCNWLLEDDDELEYCTACKLNRTVPNFKNMVGIENWDTTEQSKHRLIFQLLQLKLPVESKLQNEELGFCFDLVSNINIEDPKKRYMTGHANGVITIVLAEADPVHREMVRKQMGERYRTIVGHFRHEIGHYYWERIVARNKKYLKVFRNVFGDETASYQEALRKYYKDGPKEDWEGNYISKYATAHPWEDWAETWAHYLHLMDTLETAYYFGIKVEERNKGKHSLSTKPIINPYQEKDFNVIVSSCIPLYMALNSLNRSMGIKDIYPFVITETIIEKLSFIHNLLLSFTKRLKK